MSICELLKEYADQSYALSAALPQFHEDGKCTIDITGIRHNDSEDTDDVVYLTIESTDCASWTVTSTEKETNVTMFASPVGDYYIVTSQVGMLGMASETQDYGNIRLTKGYYGTVLCTTELVTRNIDVQWSEDGAYAVISHGISGYGRNVDLVDVTREAFLDLPGSLEVKKAVPEDQVSAETFSNYYEYVFTVKELPTAESEQITVTFFFSHPTSTDGVLGSYVYDLREAKIVSAEAAVVSKAGIPDELYP